MRKKVKSMTTIALGGLTLGALSSAGTAMGSPLVGQFTQGVGSMMPATGTMMGVGMTLDATRMLQRKTKGRK